MFKVKFLPARFGDAIWIEYGNGETPHRVLIDGGTRGTRADIWRELAALPREQRRFELVVVSHVDRDHIEGVLELLSEAEPGFEVEDVWFNGWPHLPRDPEDEEFGAVQGERLTEHIVRLGLPWNRAFGHTAVVVPEVGPLPVYTLGGGLRLTLLNPTAPSLTRLRPKWEREVRDANLDPGFALEANDEETMGDEAFGGEELPDVEALASSSYTDDRSEANGSSIAFLAEYDGKRALFAADVPAVALLAALERYSPGRQVALDLFKISHHGSKNTTSRELIEKVSCSTFVFSSNGSIFRHPHLETVSRVIVAGGGPELVFNYRRDTNRVWDLRTLKDRHKYRAIYPRADENGVEVVLRG